MFSEKNERDENWSLITCMLIVITIINLAIVVAVRALLDSEDEINEPVIQGNLRDELTIFLYIFTMTFFFGCWFCVCCCCYPCRMLLVVPTLCGTLSTSLSNLLISRQPMRKFSGTDEVEEIAIETMQRPPLQEVRADRYAYENPRNVQEQELTAEEAAPHIVLPPQKTPLGRLRSYSIDVSFQ